MRRKRKEDIHTQRQTDTETATERIKRSDRQIHRQRQRG